MFQRFPSKISKLAHPMCQPFNLAVPSSPKIGRIQRQKTNMSEHNDDKHDELLEDVDKWESCEFGADPRYARKSAPGRREDVDEKLGIQELELRLKTETVDELIRQAEDEGIIIGALLRRILEEHVDRRPKPAS